MGNKVLQQQGTIQKTDLNPKLIIIFHEYEWFFSWVLSIELTEFSIGGVKLKLDTKKILA